MNIFKFELSCNRILNLQVKLCLKLIWCPTFPLCLLSPLCFSCCPRLIVLFTISLAFHFFCSLFYFSKGNELHKAGYIDLLNPANEGHDPQAAPLASRG